jgi:hypothetical protein
MLPLRAQASGSTAARIKASKVPGYNEHISKGATMGTILVIILILLLIGVLPAWPYSSGWGYWPSGGLGLIVLILIILALTGRL